jgi:hypothetical protein
MGQCKKIQTMNHDDEVAATVNPKGGTTMPSQST